MNANKYFDFSKRVGISSRMTLKSYYLLRYLKNINTRNKKNIGLIPSNHYYGHEFWFKNYSGYKKPIKALIEHGVYFGENSSMVTNEIEYSMKKIITFGDYGETNLKKGFSDYRIVKVGPRIAYAEINKDYFNELNKNKGKTMTLFPAHSIPTLKTIYNVKELISKVDEICQKNNISNKRVSLTHTDINSEYSKIYKENGFEVVSAGLDQIDFLPKLLAIIKTTDLAISNSLGTNLGYCVFFNVPYILIGQKTKSDGRKEDIEKEYGNKNIIQKYQEETSMFLDCFNEKNDMKITKKQYDLCNYYWGFDHIKTKNDLYYILNSL